MLKKKKGILLWSHSLFIYCLDVQNVFWNRGDNSFDCWRLSLSVMSWASINVVHLQYVTWRNISKILQKKQTSLHTHLKSIQLEEVQDLHSDCVSDRGTSWNGYYWQTSCVYHPIWKLSNWLAEMLEWWYIRFNSDFTDRYIMAQRHTVHASTQLVSVSHQYIIVFALTVVCSITKKLKGGTFSVENNVFWITMAHTVYLILLSSISSTKSHLVV